MFNYFLKYCLFVCLFVCFNLKHVIFYYRLVVLGKLNNLVKEWISDVSESKVRLQTTMNS